MEEREEIRLRRIAISYPPDGEGEEERSLVVDGLDLATTIRLAANILATNLAVSIEIQVLELTPASQTTEEEEACKL